VRPDLGPEPVLERRDDPPAARVVLRVRARDDEEVERQADGEAADLDVALLEDVEEAHLDALREVRQLVDGEDPAVGTRDQPVVERQLVTQVAAFGDTDRVDLADEVGDRDVGRGELLGIAAVARQPVDRRVVTELVDERPCRRGDGRVRVVIELAAADDGDRLVEEADEQPRHPGLGLPSLAEEDEVLAGEDGVLDGGQHGLVVAHDARKDRLALAEPREQVGAQLLLDAPAAPAGSSERTEGRRAGGCGRGHRDSRIEVRRVVDSGRRAYVRPPGASNPPRSWGLLQAGRDPSA
jgi:hypothetical protein